MAEWANIQYNNESVGTLYFDDTQDKFGFIPVITSSAAAPGFGIVSGLIKASLLASRITASDSYFGILGSLDKREGFSYESGSGDLIKPTRDTSGLGQFNNEQNPSPYYLRTNENEEVVSLVQDTGDGLLVRERGDWVAPTEANYPDQDNYDIDFVSEDSIPTYDRIISENKAPVLTDFKVISPDD